MSSIGKKLVMSISGLFLILFITLHMSINLISVFSLSAYDQACEFMSVNPFIQIMVPVLALGFLVHIIYAFILTLENKKAKGKEDYDIKSTTKVSWPAKNMLVLGIIVLGVLFLHLTHFWSKMQLQEWMGNEPIKGSDIVAQTFSSTINVVIYIIWILALTFHLTHGFWSAFQSLGLNNSKWNIRIKIISHSFVTLILLGFITPVIYFYIQSF